MVLLHILAGEVGVDPIVAHFEHGIRPDSEEDFKLVQAAAKKYKLPFVAAHGHLGPNTSEATARKARYDFLQHVLEEEGADGIITAHHEDDMLETAILNMLRGTGRLGLSSLRSRDKLVRPLLGYSKEQILAYAKERGIVWHEDSTNADDGFLRNYIRHAIVPRLGQKGRDALLARIGQASAINDQIDALLATDLTAHAPSLQLDRKWFIMLPYAVASEVMAMWLRKNGIVGFDRALIDRLVVQAKTKQPGKIADVNGGYILEFTRETVRLGKKRV